MTGACRGICVRYQISEKKTKEKYLTGQKRCSFCDIYTVYEGRRCPCCGTILRTRSRTRKY